MVNACKLQNFFNRRKRCSKNPGALIVGIVIGLCFAAERKGLVKINVPTKS